MFVIQKIGISSANNFPRTAAGSLLGKGCVVYLQPYPIMKYASYNVLQISNPALNLASKCLANIVHLTLHGVILYGLYTSHCCSPAQPV